MKRHPIVEITISQPCHEPWEQMTPTGAGRHCASCEKEVVDFTRMTDGEIAAWFAGRTGRGACGRFRLDQLARPLLPAARPAPSWHRWALAAMAVFGWRAVQPDELHAQAPPRSQMVKPVTSVGQPCQPDMPATDTTKHQPVKPAPVVQYAMGVADDRSSDINIKGTRPAGTVYYVNGVQTLVRPAWMPARDVKPRRATSLKEDRANYRNMLEGEPTSIPLTH